MLGTSAHLIGTRVGEVGASHLESSVTADVHRENIIVTKRGSVGGRLHISLCRREQAALTHDRVSLSIIQAHVVPCYLHQRRLRRSCEVGVPRIQGRKRQASAVRAAERRRHNIRRLLRCHGKRNDCVSHFSQLGAPMLMVTHDVQPGKRYQRLALARRPTAQPSSQPVLCVPPP